MWVSPWAAGAVLAPGDASSPAASAAGAPAPAPAAGAAYSGAAMMMSRTTEITASRKPAVRSPERTSRRAEGSGCWPARAEGTAYACRPLTAIAAHLTCIPWVLTARTTTLPGGIHIEQMFYHGTGDHDLRGAALPHRLLVPGRGLARGRPRGAGRGAGALRAGRHGPPGPLRRGALRGRGQGGGPACRRGHGGGAARCCGRRPARHRGPAASI